jgi:hypothetical protein
MQPLRLNTSACSPISLAPYFAYSVGPQDGMHSGGAPTWQDVPACVVQARDFLLHRGRCYGEVDPLSVNSLTILAWITAGKKVCLSFFFLFVALFGRESTQT